MFQTNRANVTHVEEGASDPPMRAVLIEVKTPAPRPATAEPADGLRQVAGAPAWENNRAAAWVVMPGSSAPTHRHVGDAVELIFDGSATRKRRSCRQERFTRGPRRQTASGPTSSRSSREGNEEVEHRSPYVPGHLRAGGAAATRPLSAFGQAVDNAKQASSPSALRITELKCGYVRGSLFVKIHTNQGIWGCGEAVDAIQGTYHMVQSFGQRLRNQSPLNVHRLFEQIRKGGVFGGAQSGVFIAVLSAVETALWDLAGKALNVPVYQLLGGKFRDRIRVYLDTALYQARLPTPEQFARRQQGRQGRLYRDQVRPGSGKRSQQG